MARSIAPIREEIPEVHPDTTQPREIPRGLAAGVLAYLAAYLGWHTLGNAVDQVVVGDLAFVPITALAIHECRRAAGRAGGDRGVRSAWNLIALALLAYMLGDVVQLVYEAGAGELPYPSVSDPLYLAFYPLFLAGILRFPWAAGRRRPQEVIDALTIAIGGAAIVWYLVLGPTAYSDSGTLLGNLVAVAYPAGDLILIAALARLWIGTEDRRISRPLAWLAAGILCYVVADVIYTWQVLHATYSGGGWVDLGWMVATGLFVFAPASQPRLREPREEVEEVDEVGERSGPWLLAFPLLPYAAVAVVFALLIGSQAGDTFFPGLSLTLTAAVVAALVLARQYLARRELVLANAELHEAHAELAALATTDPLTGLPNHRALVDAVDTELDRARRYRRTCALLFIDIDYFKALNDGCGHAAGDSVLAELGELMGEELRSIDTLGRWGGEEFVVVLPEVGAEAAMVTAERLRSRVAGHTFGVAGGVHMTISVGVASYPRDGETRSAILDAADRAMYTAKHMGRNQVFSAADPTVRALRGEGGGSEADERATMGAVDALAMLVENRDRGTGDHAAEVARLAERVALALGCSPRRAREVYLAAKLHDIGKVAVADSILRKPGRLTEEEWALMRQHPVVGADVVSRVSRLARLAPIIRSHHERYDGAGYPEGLRGEDIPLEARIVGAADALDAMISDRPYHRRLALREAREELRRCAGSQFDPAVVEALDRILEEEEEEGGRDAVA